jgi:hypothetical protein
MPGDDADVTFAAIASVDRERGIGVGCEGGTAVEASTVELETEVGEGVRRCSGVEVMVGDDDDAGVGALDAEQVLGDFCGPGGIGGRPPLPRPLRMVRVSLRSRCARSC